LVKIFLVFMRHNLRYIPLIRIFDLALAPCSVTKTTSNLPMPEAFPTPLDMRLVIRTVKGERGVTYHVRVCKPGKPFESWPDSWPYVTYTLIPNWKRKLIKKLREELPVEYQTVTVGKSSRMNQIAADLVAGHGLAVLDGIKRRRINGRLRQMICGYCHTPILRGFVLEGHPVTRRKEFCSDACKMMKAREIQRRRQRSASLE
jgi:hypothetical protein